MLNNPMPYIDVLTPEAQIRELELCVQACKSSMERNSNLPGKFEMMWDTCIAAQECIEELESDIRNKPFEPQNH